MENDKMNMELQEGKQPIQVVLNDAGEGTVSLRKVIWHMKARKRLFAWVLVLCVLAGLCAPLLLYQLKNEKAAVSSVVTLQYETEEEGLYAPDGTQLDLNRITSAEVLQAALDNVALSRAVSADSLQANIRIRQVLTEESLRTGEAMAGLAKIKDAEAYMMLQYKDAQYTNRFVVSLHNGMDLQADELKMLLDRVLAAYNQYLAEKYGNSEFRIQNSELPGAPMIRYTTPEGGGTSWLKASVKKMVLGAVAGFVLGLAIWFCAGLAKEMNSESRSQDSDQNVTVEKKKTHALRNACIVLAVCLVAGTILGAVGFNRENARGRASATVQLSFQGASEGKAPDGKALDAGAGLMDEQVISAALADAGLDQVYSVKEIARHLDVAGLYPADTVGRMTGYASLMGGNADSGARMAEYYPTIWYVRLYDNLEPKASAEQMKELVQGIVSAWREKIGGEEKTVAVSSVGYAAPKVLSGAFVKRWVKSAGAVVALGALACAVGMIVVRRKEEKG